MCFLLLFSIITVVQSYAEGGADDIDQLFTSNVEIVDYSFSPAPGAPDTVTYDNDTRLLFVDDRTYSDTGGNEVRIKAAALNRMTRLGMPDSYRVA